MDSNIETKARAAECGNGEVAAAAALRAAPAAVEVDRLAQIIREVDGSHSLGAGRLAEAILSRIQIAAPAAAGVPPLVRKLVQDERDHLARSAERCDMLGPAEHLAGIQAKLRAVDAALAAMDAAPEQRAVPAERQFTVYEVLDVVARFLGKTSRSYQHIAEELAARAARQPVGQEPVAWSVVGPDGKNSIADEWRAMTELGWFKTNVKLRDGHRYVFAYAPPAQAVPEDVRRDAERLRARGTCATVSTAPGT